MQYDVLVIGGGINGLGIAADASARGLQTLIVEKNDWGSGTSSASSRLIHGGLRYLQYGEIDLVRESLRERGLLARQRPHLVHPIELLIPTYHSQKMPRWMIGVGLLMYDVLAHDPMFPHPSLLTTERTREREPGLATDGLTGGYIYPDAQVEFPERVCVELMQETRRVGGATRNHTRVADLLQEGNRVIGAVLRDEKTGETQEVRTRMVINAAGPWVDVVNRTLETPPPQMIGGTWGTHLILPMRPTGPQGPIYATAQKDGRPFFLLPWDGRLLVGTTDVKFQGNDPDDLQIEDWEIEYLLAETNLLFPEADYTEADVQATTVGIRPLPASGKEAGAITRRHFLVDHARKHGVEGIASIVGGKLTTYRSLAEEVVDWTLKALQHPFVPCPTAAPRAVPVREAQQREAQAALKRLGLPESHAGRLIDLYGIGYRQVLERVKQDSRLGAPLTPNSADIAAQVVHAVESEQARSVEDVAERRLMLFPPTPEVVEAIRAICTEYRLLSH
ncbi:MAG: glycerol-3-phosphate dehydrogenase [Armatimonadaceae bacterium]